METKLKRKLNDLEAALSNFRDALTLEPALFPALVADNIKSGQLTTEISSATSIARRWLKRSGSVCLNMLTW